MDALPPVSTTPPPSGPLPVFFDERRRRWTRTKHALPVFALFVAAVMTAFILSLIYTPLQNQRGSGFHYQALSLNPVPPVLESDKTVQARFRYRDVVNDLKQYVQTHPRGTRPDVHDFWQPTLKPFSIVAGFYVNWEASSFASFQKHASQLTHLIPEWLHLSPDGSSLNPQDDPEKQFPVVLKIAQRYHVAVLPLVNNFEPETETTKGYFDPDRAHKLLVSPANRARFIKSILLFVQQHNCQGVNLDFEELSEDPHKDSSQTDPVLFVGLVREMARAFHHEGLLVTVDVQPDQTGLGDLAAAADYLIPMIYDQHDQDSASGPIASQDWFQNRLTQFFSQVPPSRTILGIGNYAYDWPEGKDSKEIAEESVGDAVVTAQESEGKIQFDFGSLNSHYRYADDNDEPHDVWMLDALSAYNQLHAARDWEPAGAALWVIGEEDRALWNFYNPEKLGQTVDPSRAVADIPGDYQVDRMGKGEILNVTAAPIAGQRKITVNPHTGTITGERSSGW